MKKILHFEDDNELARMYQARFAEEGIQVVHYPNPTTDPVAIVLKEKPDFLLFDIVMSPLDGISAARLIKSDERTRHIPLVFLTSLSGSDTRREVLGLGAEDYLVKWRHEPDFIVSRVKEILASVK